MKEPEIKLFGRKIVLPDHGGEVAVEDFSDGGSGGAVGEREKADDEKYLPDAEDQVAEQSETKTQEKDQESQNPTISSESDENPKTPLSEDDENEQTDATNGQQKPLKKPDKILPCPRCNSMDTKFCYYNNYNVNQPRHFCKSCQRYWTAGGTMRNVPVGAGRRKNKNSASHCRHITISEALEASLIDPPNGFHPRPAFNPNGIVLSFGPDSVSCKRGESMDESSITRSSSVPKGDESCPQLTVMPNLNGAPYPVPCIPGMAWPFPWNSVVPVPAFCPMPYWNCAVPWGSGKGLGSGPNSPLGKHSRNGELKRANGLEGEEDMSLKDWECSIVVPKTMRIEDLGEAAKSSIWEALGINHNRVGRESFFKALQPKGDERKGMVSASSLLQANPAALSRSINFQETA